MTCFFLLEIDNESKKGQIGQNSVFEPWLIIFSSKGAWAFLWVKIGKSFEDVVYLLFYRS